MPSNTQPFHALTAAEWLQVTQNLTFSEVKVLYYLQVLCPYGDRDLELNLGTEAEKLGIGRSTFAAALHSLCEQQYVEINQVRPSYKVRPQLVSPIAAKKKQQQAAVSQPIAPEQPAASEQVSAQQTQCQPTVVSSDGPDECMDIDRARAERLEDLKDFSYSGEGEKKPQVVIRSRVRPADCQPQPSGPWLLSDGKFDPAFIEAVARNWVTRWGGTLSDRKTDVLLHFQKTPANIAIQWRWYAEAYRDRFEKAHMQLASGGTIDSDYQQRLIDSARAVTEELPAELDPVSPGMAAIAPVIPAATEPATSAAAIAAAEEPDATPTAGDWAAARLRLYNQWLQGDNTHARLWALSKAQEESSLQIERDAAGHPTRIVEVES